MKLSKSLLFSTGLWALNITIHRLKQPIAITVIAICDCNAIYTCSNNWMVRGVNVAEIAQMISDKLGKWKWYDITQMSIRVCM